MVQEAVEKYDNARNPMPQSSQRRGGAQVQRPKRNEFSAFEMEAFGYSPGATSAQQQINEYGERDLPTFDQIKNDMRQHNPYAQIPQTLNEVSHPAQPYGGGAPQGGIDYNYIKYLVAEAVKEVLGNGEGTLKAMRITQGNKIHFIDTKGNLYEGTLTLKQKAS